ncbi:MAG: ADP-ribosylglycohydrolase family protein [Planctomycetota bacterium]
MIFNRKDYLDKVLGCWMGKNIGGTLGAPFEWRRQINNVKFYTQDLHGEPLPNDDLDIQLLWLIAMEDRGVHINSQTLDEYWCLHVTPHWAEYGTGKINMRSGLLPPLSGTLNNAYKNSCGSFIRSEIWACIAPGCPRIAARYAYEDAILDHGNGEGVYAEVFCAVMESAAFVVPDLRKLIAIGLSYIPKDCGVSRAVRCAVDCHKAGKTWKKTRDEILRRHRGSSFFNNPQHTSPDDTKKGFAKGDLGYDAPSNVAILVAGLLYGGNDFGKMLCITVNCGEDTDCTGATAGSIFGIIHGIGAIPKKWIDPIGRGIKTIAINVGDVGGHLPKTVDDLTERTARIAEQVLLRNRGARMSIAVDKATDLGDLDVGNLYSRDGGAEFYTSLNGPRFQFDFFTVEVDYGDAPFVRSNEPKKIRLTVRNTYLAQANISVHWYMPEGWQVLPGADGVVQSLPRWLGEPVTVEFTVQAEKVTRTMNRCVVEMTIEGRPTVMLVPITLMNGNAM